MTNPLRVLLVLCAAFMAFVATPAIATAHPGHDHKIMGTIAAINGDSVTVKTTKGQERTFAITDKTTILRGKQAGARAELVVGLRVIVNVGDGHEPLKAKSVQYTAPSQKRTGTATGPSAGTGTAKGTGAGAGAGTGTGTGKGMGAGAGAGAGAGTGR